MPDAIRFLAGNPELLNAAAPFAVLMLVAAVACAIVAFDAFRELIDAHPSARRSRDLIVAGAWGCALAIACGVFVFVYLYAVNYRAAINPACEPVRYVVGAA